jgi:hypothetical protein
MLIVLPVEVYLGNILGKVQNNGYLVLCIPDVAYRIYIVVSFLFE